MPDDLITIRLNEQELEQLDSLMSSLNIKKRGTALKKGAFVGYTFLSKSFGMNLCSTLFNDKEITINEKRSRNICPYLNR